MRNPRILSSWPIRKKLLLFTLVIFFPAVGIIIALGVDQCRQEIAVAEKNALLLVQSLAAQQEHIAIGTEQMLSTLAQLPDVQRLDVNACNELFLKLKNRHPFYSSIGATTPDGALFASSTPFDPGAVNLSDRKHIKDTIGSLDFSVGEYQVGKVSKVQSLNYSYPVLDADKNLIAIVYAGFKLDEYERFITKASLPEGSAVVVTDHKGVRLYRLPANDATLPGKPVPDEGFKRISGALDQGTYERMASDGIYRIYAFKQLRLRKDSPPYLYMIVGVAKDKILHKANLKILSYLSILGLAALITLSLAWSFGNAALIKPINQLVTATKRLGSGESDVRTELQHTPDELGQLAKSFDDMASLLEAKDIERRRVEKTLREATQRLQFAVASGHMGIWDWDIQLDELTWDDGMLKLYGIAKESFPLRVEAWERALHPDDLAKTREALQAALRGKQEYDTEFRVLHPNGMIKVLKANGLLIRDDDGRPIRMIGLNRDITERKQAEEALRESEKEKAAILSGFKDVIIMYVDPNARVIWTNAAMEKASDLSIAEMKGRRCFEAVRGLREPCPGCTVLKAVATGEFQEGEIKIPDGRSWIIGNNPIKDDNGRVTGVVHVAVDITERKLAAEALKQSEEKYRMLFENSPLGIFHFDKDGIITTCNDNLIRILGSSKERVVGLNLSTSLRDETAIAAFSACMSGNRGHFEGYYRSPTGTSVKPLQSDYTPLFSEDGSISGGMAIVEDISERMQAQEALQESEKQLRCLSSRLLTAQEEERKRIAAEIHDSLGSSLSAVKIALENALKNMKEEEQPTAFLDTPILWTQLAIDEARKMMTDLRPSILDDLGLLPTISWLLRQQRAIHPSTYIEKELDIEESDIPEPLKIVIFRIMQEAFHNISKYSRAELVSLSLAKRNGGIELAIDDNGVGFDVHAVLHAKNGGRGLGLTSMKERVALSGGLYSIESIIGEGTVIRASWPTDG